MKALDTNVLIRFLVKDDELQAKAVYKLFKKAESKAEAFFIPILVVLEIFWVLEAVYEISREEIIDSIDELLLMPILQMLKVIELKIWKLMMYFIFHAKNQVIYGSSHGIQAYFQMVNIVLK